MGIGQQQPIRDTVDEVCTDVSRIIYAIFSENQNDDTLERLRLVLKVRKAAGNLKEFVKALNGYITSTLIEMFIEQLIEKYTTEEQRKAFIKEVCEIVLDSLPTFNIEERLYRILNKKYDTKEYRNIFLRLAAEQGNLNAVKYFVEKGGDISAQDEIGYTPLHLAAKQGNLDVVKYLIEKGVDVDVYQGGWSYSTALHLAAANSHLDIVKYLIEKGANPNAIDGDGKTPLQRANEKGISDIVEYLAKRVQQVTEVPQVTEDYSNTSLHLAAGQGNLNAVKYFVEKGTDINAKNERGKTPLHLAAKQSNLDIVRYLMEKGVDVNAKDRDGNTPLHIAARRGLLDIAKFLLEKGADVDAQENKFGRAPLHLAAAKGHLDIVKYLIEKGANPKATDSNGKTPMQRAAQKGHLDVVEYLKGKEQQVTEEQRTTEKQQVMNEDGDTSLHLAAVQDDLNAVKYLVEKGADVDVKNKYGATPLHIASIRGNLEIAQFLLNHGADVNAQVVNGLTPLNWATSRNHLAMVKLLLDYCADVNIQESESYAEHNFGYGTTPLISAVVACNTEIAKLLLDNGADVSIKGRGLTALDFANTKKDKCPEMLTLLKDGNIKSSDSRSHCTSTIGAFLVNQGANLEAKNNDGHTPVELAEIYHKGRSRRDISNNSWTNNSIINWVKGLVSSTKSPDLLTSRGHDNTAVTAVPEINTTVVNNTLMLGILATSLFNKTQHKQPIHENLLSPREQSMRLNNIDENMIIRAIQQGEESLGILILR